jgi:ankyrin repeat protein
MYDMHPVAAKISAFSDAARTGTVEVLKTLLAECKDDAKAQAALFCERNKFGTTPVMFACVNNHDAALTWLLANAKPDAATLLAHKDTLDEQTAMHAAARWVSEKCVPVLLANGASLLSKDKKSKLPKDLPYVCEAHKAFIALLDAATTKQQKGSATAAAPAAAAGQTEAKV